jgi:hypothetical protein
MNNATRMVTVTGKLARGLIVDGLEVNAEVIADGPNGLDERLLVLIRQYGAVGILEALHDAALGAAEIHEECDDPEDQDFGVVAVRLQVFSRKLDAAIKTLR